MIRFGGLVACAAFVLAASASAHPSGSCDRERLSFSAELDKLRGHLSRASQADIQMRSEMVGIHALRSESLAAEIVTRHFRHRLPGFVRAQDGFIGQLVPTLGVAIGAMQCAERPLN